MTYFRIRLHPEEGRSPTLNISLRSFAEGIARFQPGLSYRGNLSGKQSSLEMLLHFLPCHESPSFGAGNPACPWLWEPGTVSRHGLAWCFSFRGRRANGSHHCAPTCAVLPRNPVQPFPSLNKQLISQCFKSLFNSLY